MLENSISHPFAHHILILSTLKTDTGLKKFLNNIHNRETTFKTCCIHSFKIELKNARQWSKYIIMSKAAN